MSRTVLVPISVGDLLDTISILEIESERLSDEAGLLNVNHEMGLLKETAANLDLREWDRLMAILPGLKDVNQRIGAAEDKIRDYARSRVFGEGFLKASRSIYRLNDARATAKRESNNLRRRRLLKERATLNTNLAKI